MVPTKIGNLFAWFVIAAIAVAFIGFVSLALYPIGTTEGAIYNPLIQKTQ